MADDSRNTPFPDSAIGAFVPNKAQMPWPFAGIRRARKRAHAAIYRAARRGRFSCHVCRDAGAVVGACGLDACPACTAAAEKLWRGRAA